MESNDYCEHIHGIWLQPILSFDQANSSKGPSSHKFQNFQSMRIRKPMQERTIFFVIIEYENISKYRESINYLPYFVSLNAVMQNHLRPLEMIDQGFLVWIEFDA